MALEGKGPPDSLKEALVTHGKGSPVTSLGYGDGASVYSSFLSIPLGSAKTSAASFSGRTPSILVGLSGQPCRDRTVGAGSPRRTRLHPEVTSQLYLA